MGRWTGGSRERLQSAALQLYGEQGYAVTTVAAVAARAGLTERTFFRHFADKREVLFAEDAAMLARLVGAVRDAGEQVEPAEIAWQALRALASELQPHQDDLRVRARVIASDPDLAERDSTKQAAFALGLQEALQLRGVPADRAVLLAAVAGAVWRVAFARWLDEAGASLPERLDAAIADVRELVQPT